jgi:hypothetical protein
MTAPIQQWSRFVWSLSGPGTGNPFVDVELTAEWTHESGATLHVQGYYDGDGVYRVAFMPTLVGRWTCSTRSSAAELHAKSTSIDAVGATGTNHGPVRVRDTFHFSYADGTIFRPVGTTCYAWTHQESLLEELTLATLERSPFNKVRMCVFPKNYAFNDVEPPRYPFEGTPPKSWDTSRFNPAFFQHLERRIGQLAQLGIEADLILFHPYDEDRWGFDRMNAHADDQYVRYLVARFASFRNVWWSLANEFDFMKCKTMADWERLIALVRSCDPYDHLCSIHNGFQLYNHTSPAITHVSLQNGSAVADFGRAQLYRDVYNKPIVADEVKYEGDLPQRWGNLSAEEMVHRCWQGVIAGIYTGHGETYQHPDHVIWWARGGALYGQSPARIAFLKSIIDAAPDIDPIDKWQDLRTAGKPGEFYLIYFGLDAPTRWRFELPRQGLVAGARFRLDLIDTWSMSITPLDREFEIITDTTYRYHAQGDPTIELPGRPFMLLRLTMTGAAASSQPTDTQSRIFGEG